MGVRGILIMWQLVFASHHRLILNKTNPKGCVMVMAYPLDLGHGKNKHLDQRPKSIGGRLSRFTI